MSAEALRSQLALPSDRIIVAYDGMTWSQIVETGTEVGEFTGLGKTNATHVRPGADFAVDKLEALNQLTMLDSKYSDVPPTVRDSVYNATMAGASLITLHVSGGIKMMQAAVEGRNRALEEGPKRPNGEPVEKIGNLLGITVLTSLRREAVRIFGLDLDMEGDEDEVNARVDAAIAAKVLDFTDMAAEAGLDGVVCSPLETGPIRAVSDFDSLLIVNPGITPRYAEVADGQERTTSAAEAIRAGGDFAVVGSGINKAARYGMTKAQAAQAIGEEIAEGLERRAE